MINGESVEPPDLAALLQKKKRAIMKELNAVKPGQVVFYDPTKRTATVQLAFKRSLADGTFTSYKVLLDCPVFTLQGGGASITLPIAPGDECLVLFADANIDAWFMLGGQAVPFDQVLGAPGRRHDLSDGFALVGINSQPNPLPATVVPGEAAINNGLATVAVSKLGLVSIRNGTASLAVILELLVTALSAMTTASIASGATQAAITPLLAEIVALLY